MKVWLFCFSVLFICSCSSHKLRISTVDKGYISVLDSRLYYESTGEGKPVVLLHAGFLDHHMWRSQVNALKTSYQVITIDMPGHGLSERGKDTFLMANALAIVLDSLRIPKASLVGLSLGAVVATDFIIKYPSRVDRALLVSPGINGYETKYPLDSFTLNYFPSLMKALEKKDTPAAAEVFTKAWGDGPFRKSSEMNKEVRNYIYQTTLATMYRFKISGWPRLMRPPAIENIPQIKVPLLVIAGDKDMPYIINASDLFIKLVPGSRKVVFPRVAHMLNMEVPKSFNKEMLTFLKQDL